MLNSFLFLLARSFRVIFDQQSSCVRIHIDIEDICRNTNRFDSFMIVWMGIFDPYRIYSLIHLELMPFLMLGLCFEFFWYPDWNFIRFQHLGTKKEFFDTERPSEMSNHNLNCLKLNKIGFISISFNLTIEFYKNV